MSVIETYLSLPFSDIDGFSRRPLDYIVSIISSPYRQSKILQVYTNVIVQKQWT